MTQLAPMVTREIGYWHASKTRGDSIVQELIVDTNAGVLRDYTFPKEPGDKSNLGQDDAFFKYFGDLLIY